MVHRQLWLLTLSFTLALFSTQIRAQQNNPSAAKEQITKAQQKAFDLLESLAGQISSLQSAQNRARIGSNIAGSLWKHDQTRARTLFALVAEEIKSGLQSLEVDEDPEAHTFLVFLKLRADTVERIAKHDARYALDFFKATDPGADRTIPYRAAESQRAMEMELAKQIAAESPELAIELGRKSLARGLANDVLFILRKINRKDKEQARLLHKEIVQRLKEFDFPRDWDDTRFAEELVQSFMPPAAEDSTFKDLMNLFITRALRTGCGNKLSEDDRRRSICQWFGKMLYLMEKVDPARTVQLKQWVPEIAESNMSSQAAYHDLNDVTQGGKVDEVLAVASKYPEIAEEAYWRAAMMAMSSGDFERARTIANDFRGDPEKRKMLLDQLERAEEWAAIDEEKLATLQKTATTIPVTKDRTAFFLFAATRMAGRNQKMATKLINLADEAVATMKPGKEQMEAQFSLATMYCLVKSDRGFALMESFVPKLNELVDAAAKLDGYDTNYLRDNEWNMTGAGSLGSLLTSLANHAAYFAWSDFDRAVSLAGRFDRNEIRIMAQLKLAQGILNGPPETWPTAIAQ